MSGGGTRPEGGSGVVGVIPARWGSTRFPGKSLAPIAGKPLIQWVTEAALRARRLDKVIVATDDVRIAEAVAPLAAEAVMTRPDHPSGTDRVAEAVASTRAEIIINIQGDEPLMSPDLIDRLAGKMLEEPGWDMATAAMRLEEAALITDPSVVKVVFDRSGRALYFSRSPIPYIREPETDGAGTTVWGHIGIYAYRRGFLERLVRTPPCMLERAERLEQLRALYLGARMAVVETAERGMGVDTPEDVQYVEALLKEREAQG